jgi:phospholipid transport system substrate-binding protein
MTAIDKRGLLAVVAVFAFSILIESAAAGMATEQIRNTVDQALLVLKDPRLRPPEKTQERRAQLKQVLFPRFDFTEMAKRALGANWRQRTAQEQEEFVQLFTELLERSYADIIETYTDQKIVYVGETQDGGYADVASKILTSNGVQYSLNYKAHLVNGEWRVYDVVAENISVVNNFRSQFDRVIARSSYQELVRRLRDKAAFAGPKK